MDSHQKLPENNADASAEHAKQVSEKPGSVGEKPKQTSSRKKKSEPKKTKNLTGEFGDSAVDLLACTALLIVGLGALQRLGFISSGGAGGISHSSGSENTRYICPMMCTPPLPEPGNCPVCGMKLNEIKSGDGRSVQIDPASRRVINIQTVPVRLMTMSREIQAIGRLNYNEGALKTISAYVDGRIEKLYADYTGVVVKKDDRLALIYSPKLYSSQVELLLAMDARNKSKKSTLIRVAESNQDLLESSRQRLIELGMTQTQIIKLEKTNKANSRMHLLAPISGTVIKKYAVEGAYVKKDNQFINWLIFQRFGRC